MNQIKVVLCQLSKGAMLYSDVKPNIVRQLMHLLFLIFKYGFVLVLFLSDFVG